jgi:hypothetical protein
MKGTVVEVWYSAGVTIPTGNYASARIDFGEKRTVAKGESKQEVYEAMVESVDAMVNKCSKEITEAVNGNGAKPRKAATKR